jgi:hypothetical protein
VLAFNAARRLRFARLAIAPLETEIFATWRRRTLSSCSRFTQPGSAATTARSTGLILTSSS